MADSESTNIENVGDGTANQIVEHTNDQQIESPGNGDAASQQTAPQQSFSFWGVAKTLMVRMLFIYFITSLFRKGTPPPQSTDVSKTVPNILPAANVFPKGTFMDLYFYISEDEVMGNLSRAHLFWQESHLEYGAWDGGHDGQATYIKSDLINISERVQNNGSLYLHMYVVKEGYSPDPSNTAPQFVIYKKKQLNRYKKRRFHTMKNLLTGTTDAHSDLIKTDNTSDSFEVLSFWHPNLTINLVDDHTGWQKGSIPSPLDEHVVFLPGDAFYYPILYINDYWNLNRDYTPINSTTTSLNLTMTYHPLSLFKWQMYAAQTNQNKWLAPFMGEDAVESSDEDQDSLKITLLDTNPVLLLITAVVSIIHSVFEFLAFKNDIQFWNNRSSLEGLSVRSVFFNVFQSVIVLLYVLDNETNFVIKVTIFIGLLIEIWKIHKVIDIKLDRENKWFGIIPKVWYTDKSTYTQSKTKEYDLIAFKYLSWLFLPLLMCYGVYSVIYLEHKGWYSWVLSMLYSFLLTFGFIMMTPQLFINYKLKSVAHLPWRMLTYKALNTFIDDLFAFVIRMPLLYRIGCFRDDIVFCIFLYQRWIYRVDPTRMNEFGTTGADPTTIEPPQATPQLKEKKILSLKMEKKKPELYSKMVTMNPAEVEAEVKTTEEKKKD